MENNNNDFTEDHGWFTVMWKGRFIQLFMLSLVALAGIICTKDTFSGPVGFYITASVPALSILAIGYFAFYRMWKNLKSGKST
jgi:hypothetical protein